MTVEYVVSCVVEHPASTNKLIVAKTRPLVFIITFSG